MGTARIRVAVPSASPRCSPRWHAAVASGRPDDRPPQRGAPPATSARAMPRVRASRAGDVDVARRRGRGDADASEGPYRRLHREPSERHVRVRDRSERHPRLDNSRQDAARHRRDDRPGPGTTPAPSCRHSTRSRPSSICRASRSSRTWTSRFCRRSRSATRSSASRTRRRWAAASSTTRRSSRQTAWSAPDVMGRVRGQQ